MGWAFVGSSHQLQDAAVAPLCHAGVQLIRCSGSFSESPTSSGRSKSNCGPNQPSVLFEGQLHGAGYALGWLPAPDSRASLSRRVCCEGHPATGCQAIGSLEMTCHVALVSVAGLGSSSGK
jgi:hypothetical protein